jgi:hypothetical protein
MCMLIIAVIMVIVFMIYREMQEQKADFGKQIANIFEANLCHGKTIRLLENESSSAKGQISILHAADAIANKSIGQVCDDLNKLVGGMESAHKSIELLKGRQWNMEKAHASETRTVNVYNHQPEPKPKAVKKK